jgi:hypothetical protein
LPPGYRFTLLDGDSGAIVDMHASSQYLYTPEPGDAVRGFAILAEAVSAGSGDGGGDSGGTGSVPVTHGLAAHATDDGGCVSAPSENRIGPISLLILLAAAGFLLRRKKSWTGLTRLTGF